MSNVTQIEQARWIFYCDVVAAHANFKRAKRELPHLLGSFWNKWKWLEKYAEVADWSSLKKEFKHCRWVSGEPSSYANESCRDSLALVYQSWDKLCEVIESQAGDSGN